MTQRLMGTVIGTYEGWACVGKRTRKSIPENERIVETMAMSQRLLAASRRLLCTRVQNARRVIVGLYVPVESCCIYSI